MQVRVFLQADLSIILNSRWSQFHLYLETSRNYCLFKQWEEGW